MAITMVVTAFVLIGGALVTGVLARVAWLLLTRCGQRDQDVINRKGEPVAAARADRSSHEGERPAALREVKASQRKGERHRRWFSNADFDLIVWFEPLDAIAGFELCYDRSGVERALSWSAEDGYRHWRVDTGEASGYMHSMTPTMERDDVTAFPKDRVIAAFAGAADAIDPMVRSFVIQRLREVTRAETGESRFRTGRAGGEPVM